MSKNIDCRIIQDLFPSYIDGLTSKYTNQAIEEHIMTCEPCNQMLQRMQAPEKHIDSTKIEVDYMKKIRKKMSGLLAVSLISIGIFMLGALVCFMIYKRVVPQNYQQVFATAEPTWFIAHHDFTDCEIDIFDYEAEDFSGMLKNSKFYYEGFEPNVIYGDMFTIMAGSDVGAIYEIRITDEYKLYYDGKVYDIRDSKHLWDYLERRVKEEPEWIVYEKAAYKYLDGKYVMKTEGNQVDAISFELDMDTRTFVLSPGAYSSVHEYGAFSIDGLTVTLNGKYDYIFQITDEGILNYDADKSDSLCVFGEETPIPSGTLFYKE